MLKAELRKICLAQQKSLSPAERKNLTEQIAERFFQSFDLRQINFLHCFLPIEKFGEIDTRLIFERVWREFPNIKTVLPRVNFATNEIEKVRFIADTELAENQWQISEPKHGELIETEKIDMVLVPLLCFDLQGFRVGYGKGFYDKFLNNCRADCLKIGLSFFPQVEKIEDVNEFDVRLDYCLTPNEIYKF